MANSTGEIPSTVAATSTLPGNTSNPVILHTLLDDEDMFVGSGDQENPPLEAEGKELESEVRGPEVRGPEVREPEVKEDAQMSSEEELERNDEDGDSGDDDADEDDVYEVVENTSDILGYFKGKEKTRDRGFSAGLCNNLKCSTFFIGHISVFCMVFTLANRNNE